MPIHSPHCVPHGTGDARRLPRAGSRTSIWKGYLRPAPDIVSAAPGRGLPIPFYQAVPVAQGVLYPAHLIDSAPGLRHDSGTLIRHR